MTNAHAPGTQVHHGSPFWRHFLEMLAVMVAGMVASAAVVVITTGATTWDEVTTEHGTQALLAMAIGMSAPMVAWMVRRGMSWRNAGEMAAAMVLPVIPFLCLFWFGVTRSAACGGYCAMTVVSMLGVMAFRRSEYSRPM